MCAWHAESKLLKAQSALEYMTTYAWMFIIVIIALAVLYALGFFNLGSQATGQPGACQIYRPNGPGTIQGIALSGVCNNAAPKFVASFTGAATSNVVILPNSTIANVPYLTVSVWVNPTTVSGTSYIISSCSSGTTEWAVYTVSGTVTVYENTPGGSHTVGSAVAIGANKWYNVQVTYDGSNTIAYVNDVGSTTSTAYGVVLAGNVFVIGNNCGASPYPSGYMSNLQVYSNGFTSNEVKSLYLEGIGGVPTYLSSLVLWNPLNSNPNDFSGNNANALAQNVKYTTQWTGGYTPP